MRNDGVIKQHAQHVVPNSYDDVHSAKSARHQYGDSVNFQHADNQAEVLPVSSATEPYRQPGRLKDIVQQNGGYGEQALQGDVWRQRTDFNGDIVCVNPSEIQRSVQRKNYPPVTFCDVGDEHLEPVSYTHLTLPTKRIV